MSTTTFDHLAINHMTTAISEEMNPAPSKSRKLCDTLFMGGPVPDEHDQHQLAQLGLKKNWKIVYPSFDPADAARGPTTFHVVVTDGLTETLVLQDGRLWKNDRRSPAMLVFAHLGITVRVSAKGRLMVGPMKPRHHDHGYELALQSVSARAAREPGRAAVLSSVGRLPTVIDIRTMKLMFDNAE